MCEARVDASCSRIPFMVQLLLVFMQIKPIPDRRLSHGQLCTQGRVRPRTTGWEANIGRKSAVSAVVSRGEPSIVTPDGLPGQGEFAPAYEWDKPDT